MISIYCISQSLNHQLTILLSHIFFKSPLFGFLIKKCVFNQMQIILTHLGTMLLRVKPWSIEITSADNRVSGNFRKPRFGVVRSFTEGFATAKCENIDVVAGRLKVEYVFYIYINCGFLAVSFVPWPSITRIEILYLLHYYSKIFLWYSKILRYCTLKWNMRGHWKCMASVSQKKTSAMFIHPFSTSKILGKKRQKNSKTHVPSLKPPSQKDPKGNFHLPTSNHQF